MEAIFSGKFSKILYAALACYVNRFKCQFSIVEKASGICDKLKFIASMKWSNDDFSWFLSLLKTKLLELGRTDDQNIYCLVSKVRLCAFMCGSLLMDLF